MLSWAYVTPDQWIRNIRGSEWEMLWARYMSSATYNICYSRIDLSTVPEGRLKFLCTRYDYESEKPYLLWSDYKVATFYLTDDIQEDAYSKTIAHSVPKSALFDTMISLMADQRRVDDDL